jgi:hypothetical protein
MLGFILTTLIFIGVLVGSSLLTNMSDIKANWQTYRCRPDVMLMAPIYGEDASKNLEFCLKVGFDKRASSATSPFYTYLAGFTGVLTTMLSSINSIKMIFATIIGTATTVFSEFSQRIQALFYRIQLTAIKLKYLMSRVFAAFYSVIYMGTGGVTAGINFSNTALFNFINFFCFEPETLIGLKDRGIIMIRDVRIGDVLEGGDVVTATFEFFADGQGMVRLADEGIIVSTNHFLLHKGRWIQAKDHPRAVSAGDWDGGVKRPLICLNTDTHSFKIGAYTFKDYDETSEGDAESMQQVLQLLNNKSSNDSYTADSTMACHPGTGIKCPALCKTAKDIVLGDIVSQGTVVGIVRKLTRQVCHYGEEVFAAGTAIWHEETRTWKRAGDLVEPVVLDEPMIFVSFVVSPSACVETTAGTVFRDYVEVHSPDLEAPYAKALGLKQESL